MSKRLIVIDEQPITRAGIAAVLGRRQDLEVVGQTSDPVEALRLVEKYQPDLAITDLSFRPGMQGCDLVKLLRSRSETMRVLVLSGHDEELYGERAFGAGASGYLMKRAPLSRLLEAIDRVLQGQSYASSELLERLAERPKGRSAERDEEARRPAVPLSPREIEVLSLIGRGVGTREIAQRLGLSVKTVETHRAHLKTKLSLESAPQLLRYAVQWVADNDVPEPPSRAQEAAPTGEPTAAPAVAAQVAAQPS